MSDVILTETFHEIPVRIIQGENGPMIPLVDIAHGIGYTPQTLTQLYERNSKLLDNYSQRCMIHAPGSVAPVEHLCLSRDGITGILIKIDYRRVKDPLKSEKILAFQKWVIEIIGKVMDGSFNQPLLPPLSNALKKELARADAMTIVGVDRGLAASVCMSKLEDQYGEDLGYLRRLVPRQIDDDIPHLNATAIGRDLSLSPQTVNKILESSGYQFNNPRVKRNGKSANVWNLTEKGKQFGEIHIERHGGKEIFTILWRSSMLDELRKILGLNDYSQRPLLAEA